MTNCFAVGKIRNSPNGGIKYLESRKSFLQPIPSTLGNVKRLIKPLLTGDGQAAYIAPNAARLAQTISNNLSVLEDKNSGMLKLSMESAKPELASDLMLALIRETDGFLKERFVVSGSEALQFINRKFLKRARANTAKHWRN